MISTKCKVYPNYTDNYCYSEGYAYIRRIRIAEGNVVARHTITFGSPEEAKEYFENNCGA